MILVERSKVCVRFAGMDWNEMDLDFKFNS